LGRGSDPGGPFPPGNIGGLIEEGEEVRSGGGGRRRGREEEEGYGEAWHVKAGLRNQDVSMLILL
jgi:hypothetical protein